jgi:hypothetical protein
MRGRRLSPELRHGRVAIARWWADGKRGPLDSGAGARQG